MISADDCRAHAVECEFLGKREFLGKAANPSMERAAILLDMSRRWIGLAKQVDRYEAMVKSEGVLARRTETPRHKLSDCRNGRGYRVED